MLRKESEKDPINYGLVIYTKNGNLIQNPLVAIANKAARDCLRYGSELGLTPIARTRISIDPGNTPNKSKSRNWFD